MTTLIQRDWVGRRMDLREFHRDPWCSNHSDPLLPCTCRPIFREWDRVLDWVFCFGLIGAIILLYNALPIFFSSTR